MLCCGYKVFAVEPNGDMRRKAEETLSGNKNFISVNGRDSRMNLPDRSADHITAAQAYHWFDSGAFRKECGRVLKPGGKVMLVYNSREESADCTKALAKRRKKYDPDFRGFSNGMSEEKCIAFFEERCDVFRADNPQVYDLESYVNLILSSSYSLEKSDSRYAEYLEGIRKIFDACSADGCIAVPTATVAYIGEV